MSFLEIDFD